MTLNNLLEVSEYWIQNAENLLYHILNTIKLMAESLMFSVLVTDRAILSPFGISLFVV